jgi:cytochrome b
VIGFRSRPLLKPESAGRPAVGANDDRRRVVRVWDGATRLFHWLIVILVAGAYATWRLNWMNWHERLGDAVLALVLFRLAWGCLGSDSARFGRFLTMPQTVWRYLAHALRREPDTRAGHNPAGGWMVALLLLLLLGETLTGLFLAHDIADVGPFTDVTPAAVANAIDALHTILWNALLAAVALHVLAIAFYAAIKGQNLLLPMITGTKVLPASVPQPRIASARRAALVLAVSVAAAVLIANLL